MIAGTTEFAAKLQDLPQELIHRIFTHLDYESLHLFQPSHGIYVEAFTMASYSILRDAHYFVSNYHTLDFNESVSSQYVENIARIVDVEMEPYHGPCSHCHHEKLVKGGRNIHISSCFEPLSVAPRTLSLYLLVPGTRNDNGKSSFSMLIHKFMEIINNKGSQSSLSLINKINVFVDYDENLISPVVEELSGEELIATNMDLSIYRSLHELEKTCFANTLIRERLCIFSIVSQNHSSWFHGLVDTGIMFYSPLVQNMSSISHLSLPYHVLGHSIDNESAFFLPNLLRTLNLSFSSSLALALLMFGKFPPLLESLNLSGCNIGSLLDKNTIKFPTTIRHLNLSHNNIKSIQDLKLPHLLRTLELTDNQISSLNGPYNSSYNFPLELVNLNLSHNNLILINSIQFPPKLVRLYLSGNLLSDSYGNSRGHPVKFPSSLLHLDLSMNNYTELTGLQFPPRLQELDVSNNQISRLSDRISLDTQFYNSLIMLNISGNPLELLSILFCADSCRFPKLKALFMNSVLIRNCFHHQKGAEFHIYVPESLRFLHMWNTGLQGHKCRILNGRNLKVMNIS